MISMYFTLEKITLTFYLHKFRGKQAISKFD